jgi:tetratricopeptide (TPR) repeat protein
MERFQSLQAAARERDQRAWELKLLRQTALMDVERGRMQEAVARLREALEIEPTADAYFSLGVVLKRAGRHQESLDALDRAATLGAGPGVHVHLAEVYAALGRPEDSRRQHALRARANDERFRARGGR